MAEREIALSAEALRDVEAAQQDMQMAVALYRSLVGGIMLAHGLRLTPTTPVRLTAKGIAVEVPEAEKPST